MTKTGIYKITNPIGAIYIGESEDIERRWNRDYKKLRCKGQIRLYNSFIFYGVENHTFEIVKECTVEEIPYYERYYQEYYNVLDKEYGLNCKLRNVGEKKQVYSDETREKMSESQKKLYASGYINPNTGLNVSEVQKKKQSDSMKKLYENAEQIEKNRQAQIKRYQSENYINPSKGKKRTEEQKQKFKDSHYSKKEGYVNPNKGKKRSEEQKQKFKDNHCSKKEGYVSPYAKKVINTQSGFIYNSGADALRASGLKYGYTYFNDMLRGKKPNKTNFEYIKNEK
jgi:group I intron endonuclease